MKTKKGFTLIEIIVAVTIFTAFVIIFTTVVVSFVKSQGKSLASQLLVDNTSYVLEYMSRALRMAQKDYLGTCINVGTNYKLTQGGKGIKFVNYSGVCQEFYWNDQEGKLYEKKDLNESLAITPLGLKVNSFEIEGEDTWGQDQIPLTQPKVTLFLGAEKEDDPQVFINVRTTVSQRNLNHEF